MFRGSVFRPGRQARAGLIGLLRWVHQVPAMITSHLVEEVITEIAKNTGYGLTSLSTKSIISITVSPRYAHKFAIIRFRHFITEVTYLLRGNWELSCEVFKLDLSRAKVIHKK